MPGTGSRCRQEIEIEILRDGHRFRIGSMTLHFPIFDGQQALPSEDFLTLSDRPAA